MDASEFARRVRRADCAGDLPGTSRSSAVCAGCSGSSQPLRVLPSAQCRSSTLASMKVRSSLWTVLASGLLIAGGCGGSDAGSDSTTTTPATSAQGLRSCLNAQGLGAQSLGSITSAEPLVDLQASADGYFSALNSAEVSEPLIGPMASANITGVVFYVYPDASAAESAAGSVDSAPSASQGTVSYQHQIQGESNVVWVYTFAAREDETLGPPPRYVTLSPAALASFEVAPDSLQLDPDTSWAWHPPCLAW